MKTKNKKRINLTLRPETIKLLKDLAAATHSRSVSETLDDFLETSAPAVIAITEAAKSLRDQRLDTVEASLAATRDHIVKQTNLAISDIQAARTRRARTSKQGNVIPELVQKILQDSNRV